VITADHTSEGYNSVCLTRTGMYEVPVIFYKHKSNLKGINHTVTQQTDIMPTILDYLNYDGDYITFGTDVLDTAKVHFAVNYTNETYQIIEGDYSLIFDGNKTISLFNRKTDRLLKKNLAGTDMKLQSEMEGRLKAYLQSYNERLIKNKLSEN
jgi:phosphoglycerol transferase MdoB-like AlkP superfamily enzyme